MPDTQIHPTGNVSTPADYLIPDAAELHLKNAYAHFDGSGAGSSYLPLLRIVSDAGSIMVEAVADTTIAAGASCDASWFPDVGGGTGAGSAAQATAFFDGNAPLVLTPWGNVMTNYPFAALDTNSSAVYSWPSGLDVTKIHISEPGVYQTQYHWQGSGTAFPAPPATILSRIVTTYSGAVVSDLSVNSANADVFRGLPTTNPPFGPTSVTTFNMQFAGDFQIQVAYTGATSYTLGDLSGFLVRLGDVIF